LSVLVGLWTPLWTPLGSSDLRRVATPGSRSGWAIEGPLHTCAHCGNALNKRAEGWVCTTRARAEALPNRPAAVRFAPEAVLRLTRGIRLYWQEPGFDEIRVFDELAAAGLGPILYPHRDRVDIEVGEVGIDLKAYVSPELLGTRIERNLGGLAHYRHKWLAVPDRLVRRVPAYLERLRAALGATPVRCLATSQIRKELAIA
jgi:REase associating with pPIWI_RE